MVRKKIMKTILAKGAPWPKPEAPAEKVKQKRPPITTEERSTRQKTDEMFNLWLSRNVGGIQ